MSDSTNNEKKTSIPIKDHVSLTALVFTVEPNPLLSRCIDNISHQTIKATRVEIIRDVMPAYKAKQQGLDLVRTDYFVVVDGDMILAPNCFEVLLNTLRADEKLADVAFSLNDPVAGKILGIHMYRTKPMRVAGFDGGDKKDEHRYAASMLQKIGYKVLYDNQKTVGMHHPVYMPVEAYWKYKERGEKCCLYEREGYASFSRTLDSLCEYWAVTRDAVGIYALAGVLDGIRSDHSDQPFSYEGRENAPGYLKLRSVLSNMAGYDAAFEKSCGIDELQKEQVVVGGVFKRIGEKRVLDYISMSEIALYLVKRLFRRFMAFTWGKQ